MLGLGCRKLRGAALCRGPGGGADTIGHRALIGKDFRGSKRQHPRNLGRAKCPSAVDVSPDKTGAASAPDSATIPHYPLASPAWPAEGKVAVRLSPYRMGPKAPEPPPNDPGRPFFMAACAVAVLAPCAVVAARQESWAGEVMVIIGVVMASGLMSWFR